MRRSVKVIVVVVLVVVLLAVGIVVGGSLLLRSDWLGERILAAAGARVGLDLRAASFSLGWGGEATLERVQVRMPLRDTVVFSADQVRLGIGPLPRLLFGRPVSVRSVMLERPTVFLRRLENGTWNVQEVWTRVQAGLGSSPAPGRRVRLPEVLVRQATVQITGADGAAQTVGPFVFDGRRRGAALWGFDLRALPLAGVEGQVVEGGDWTHEIQFRFGEGRQSSVLSALIPRMRGEDLPEIRLAGRWKGAVAGKMLRGMIRLDECVLGRAALRGSARVEAASDSVTIRPRDLTVTDPNLAGQPIQLADGAVGISRERIVLESLTARAGVFGGKVDGRWDWEPGCGEFSGSWAGAGSDPTWQYDGTYRLTAASPRQGRKEARAQITMQTRTAAGLWQATIDGQGGGADWATSQWQIELPALSWMRGERRAEVANAVARLEVRWPTLQLTSLAIPAAKQANARAQFDARTRRWSVQMMVEQLTGLSPGAAGLDFRVSADGDAQAARISELRAALDAKTVTIQGGLSFAGWALRDVHLAADWPAHTPGFGGTGASAGRWRLEGAVTGQIHPLALDAQAALTGQKIALGKRPVDRVQVPVQVHAEAQRVEATTAPFELLGGQWQVTGRHELSGGMTHAYVMVADLSLAAVAGMAGLPLSSQGQARAAIALEVPGLEVQQAVATGSWNAWDVRIPPLAAQQAQGRLRIAAGLVRLENIRLEQAEGRAQADASFRLAQPEVVSIEANAQGWPVSWEGCPVTLVVDGRTKLEANVASKTADGDAQLTGKVVWQDKDLAALRLATRVQGQKLDVHEFHAQALGGSADGTAVIPLNHWVDSVAQLRWRDLELKHLAAWLPAATRLQGGLSGSLVFEQTAGGKGRSDEGGRTRDTRPLGPLRFVLDANVAHGRFGPAVIDGARVRGYLDPRRLLVENADFDVLGGRLLARARFSRHAGKYYGSVVTDFNDLSLDQLVHAVDPNAAAHPGRLAGNLTVLPAFDQGVALAGGGRIRLSDSDLLNNAVVRILYNTLNLHFGSQTLTGTGEIQVQFEGPAVAFPSIQYFNRGVEIRGAARIGNVNLGSASPVEGYAVASTRILKGVKLPGIGALDRLLDVLQTAGGSVKIAGDVGHVQVRVVPLPEILSPFRRLLWAQLRE